LLFKFFSVVFHVFASLLIYIFGAKDVIRTVRGECGADLPAMIITGNTDPKRIQELKALEAPVLFKPVSGANILGALEALRKQG